MDFTVLTLFPELVREASGHSIFKRGLDQGLLNLHCVNIRDFAANKHNRADDYPYGGGCGMVMKAQPVYDAYRHARQRLGADRPPRVIFLTPAGRRLDQTIVQDLAREEALILLCGHYEGIDERVVEEIVTDEISIGDYILTGGELAALVLMDAVARLVPGVLGKEASFKDESFSANLLEYPQYTRPSEVLGRHVPDILLSGDHKAIDRWRGEQARIRTEARRPDLLG
ncbi:MAG: tRNA (guanosine(37)-N1)-methyltransferase TrmD [Defluviitaleaceae bacterium]|nr:tRNA (guanosine(37)-N1)-methyltransferase TrmD [Defluviitaleaceae bacterium]